MHAWWCAREMCVCVYVCVFKSHRWFCGYAWEHQWERHWLPDDSRQCRRCLCYSQWIVIFATHKVLGEMLYENVSDEKWVREFKRSKLFAMAINKGWTHSLQHCCKTKYAFRSCFLTCFCWLVVFFFRCCFSFSSSGITLQTSIVCSTIAIFLLLQFFSCSFYVCRFAVVNTL